MQSCQLASPSCKLGVSAAGHILFPQSACNVRGGGQGDGRRGTLPRGHREPPAASLQTLSRSHSKLYCNRVHLLRP